MAQLAEGVHFSGSIGNLTFYQRWGKTFVRTKGSVTRERVLKNREYSKTRQYANNLALASRIASPVYNPMRHLPVLCLASVPVRLNSIMLMYYFQLVNVIQRYAPGRPEAIVTTS
jgi:hypothetical protein